MSSSLSAGSPSYWNALKRGSTPASLQATSRQRPSIRVSPSTTIGCGPRSGLMLHTSPTNSLSGSSARDCSVEGRVRRVGLRAGKSAARSAWTWAAISPRLCALRPQASVLVAFLLVVAGEVARFLLGLLLVLAHALERRLVEHDPHRVVPSQVGVLVENGANLLRPGLFGTASILRPCRRTPPPSPRTSSAIVRCGGRRDRSLPARPRSGTTFLSP